MYDYLRGVLSYVGSGYIIVECHGLGFHLSVADRWLVDLAKQVHHEVQVYTHVVIRETEHVLYGFCSRSERECFRMLIAFSGIGPKTGLSILNTFSLHKLCAIVRTEDIKAISSVPGIGKKTAEKFMVDLKQKFSELLLLDPHLPTQESPSHLRMDEGIQALMALGYSRSSAERMFSEAMHELPAHASLSEIIPIALKKHPQGLNKS